MAPMTAKIPFFLLVCLHFAAGCGQAPVSGEINLEGTDYQRTVYLIKPPSFSSLLASFEGKVIDSAGLDDNGKFSFHTMPEAKEETLYLLVLQKKGEKFLSRLENENPAEANYLPFLYRDGKPVHIKVSSAAMMTSATITGGPEANADVVKLAGTWVNLHKKYISAQEPMTEENLIGADEKKAAFRAELMESVRHAENVHVLALALRWCSPSGDYERMPDAVKSACLKLQASSPNHPWTAQICALTKKLPPVVGDPFPDVMLPMMEGDTVSLTALMGKKLTLVDLWASWCAPCRKENREILVPLWDRFHKKGFSITGYALDASEKGWKAAIKKDGVDRWKHASHLQGDHSPLFESLKITTIPANYLLDEKGIIVAKNLHGEALVKWVEAYLNREK